MTIRTKSGAIVDPKMEEFAIVTLPLALRDCAARYELAVVVLQLIIDNANMRQTIELLTKKED